MKKKKYIFIFILILLGLDSCQYLRTTLEPKYCPQPQVTCSPKKYDGIPRDTSELVSKIQGWHYRVEEVQQLNSAGDEWALGFDGLTPYLTISDGNKNTILQCKYLTFNKILPQKTLLLNSGEGSYGFPAFNNHEAFFSFEKDNKNSTQNEFIDSSGRILVPLNESIGQSSLYSGKISNNQISLSNKIEISHSDISEWYSQPAFTPDGKIMFFASDRKGSIGGVDIWMSYNKDGIFSEPINCGDKVNTECEEITPYVSPDGKYLYFASNGGETVGGFDIFRVDISDLANSSRLASTEEINQLNVFKNRENIRAPFNTPYNEISPSCNGNCDSILYYSSNQNQTPSTIYNKGGFDIFVRYKVFKKEVKTKKEIEEPKLAIEKKEDVKISGPKDDLFYRLEGNVYEQSTSKPLENAEVTTEETTGKKKNKVNTNSKGYYSIPMLKNERYLVTAQNKDLFPQNATIFLSAEDTIKIVRQDFYLPEKYILRINFPTDIYDAPYRYVLDSTGKETDVLWNEDITALANNIISAKETILKIVLVGHTDDVASVEYNQKLGERRVNFVIDELVKHGVPREMLEGRSAGKLEPLKRWENESLEMYRKRLRRVVLEKILK